MTDIRIKQLTLENFKCHRHLALELNGRNASVYGDNASGKTSIYDALTWLLFGKDSAGNGEKNIEIKPLDANGDVQDHLAETSVEALLQVGSEELSLRRTFKEVWTTKRGTSEATFDGNTSEYFIDGVPVKKMAFNDKVQSLVDEETFRMLTSVSYFASGISWQDRRAELFKIAGVADDRQILATDGRFAPILEGMRQLSLEEYKKKLQAEKKGFVSDKVEIPARISECQKTIDAVAGVDFQAARTQVDKLTAEKNGIAAQILALDNQGGADEKALQIRKVQLELDALEKENELYRSAQMSGGVDVRGLNMRLTSVGLQLEKKNREAAGEEAYIRQMDEKVDQARRRWLEINGEAFSGGSCPTCGQALPVEQLRAAMEHFESGKAKQLSEIQATADSYKAAKAQAESRLDNCRSEILQLEAEQKNIREQIAAAESVRVEPKDMEDYAQRKKAFLEQLDKLNDELHEIHENVASVKAKLRQEEASVSNALNEQMEILGKESLLAYTRQRIEQLREDARNSASCLAAIEKMLYLMDEFTRYKTRFVEDSINEHFRLARFRLFREQANGGVEDRCDVVYDGVPYISVNNGMKINLGVDIINTLSRAYGVRVPLFVDNAESVTELEQSDSQIVRLVVSQQDKELRFEYEN